MKSATFIQKLFMISAILVLSVCAWADRSIDWDAFSQNLAKAIKNENPGLQQSAMCMMIRYGDRLEIDRNTVYDIVRIFRTDKNENVRLLALMALYKTQDPWAMNFLKRHRKFEKQERVKRLCCCAVQSYYAKLDSSKQKTILAAAGEKVIAQHAAQSAELIDIERYGLSHQE